MSVLRADPFRTDSLTRGRTKHILNPPRPAITLSTSGKARDQWDLMTRERIVRAARRAVSLQPADRICGLRSIDARVRQSRYPLPSVKGGARMPIQLRPGLNAIVARIAKHTVPGPSSAKAARKAHRLRIARPIPRTRVLVRRWKRCIAPQIPGEDIGVEFTAGGHYYPLTSGPDGSVVRRTGVDYEGTTVRSSANHYPCRDAPQRRPDRCADFHERSAATRHHIFARLEPVSAARSLTERSIRVSGPRLPPVRLHGRRPDRELGAVMLTRVKTSTGSPSSKLSGTKSFRGSSIFGFENRTESLRDTVGHGFQADKPPFALINQRGVQTAKLHHEPVPVGANRDRPVRGMLVCSHDFFDRKVERGIGGHSATPSAFPRAFAPSSAARAREGDRRRYRQSPSEPRSRDRGSSGQ